MHSSSITRQRAVALAKTRKRKKTTAATPTVWGQVKPIVKAVVSAIALRVLRELGYQFIGVPLLEMIQNVPPLA